MQIGKRMNKYITKFEGKYRFLSNFWDSIIPDDTIFSTDTYQSVEAAYQASKTHNSIEKDKIRLAKSAGEAKRLGKKVTIRQDWEDVKDSIMLDLLRSKFLKKDDLTYNLMETGDAELIEGNNWCDNYWGICYCNKCNGMGRNVLGQLLMMVREEAKIRFEDKK